MKITIESTAKVVELFADFRDGSDAGVSVPARIWEGHTDSGIPVHCYITRIAVEREEDTAQFDAELLRQAPPSAAVVEIPMGLVL